MGDKLSAREAAQAAECPVVPGMMEPTDDPEEVKAFAVEHGYPLIIKAAYGGGGRGMKVVRADDELAEALESAQREAIAAFGRGEVYVERYLARPRHVEIQILRDSHGNTKVLGLRDCSVQRNNQKIIEESGSTMLPRKLEKELYRYAKRLADEIGYVGAGTVEFIYDLDNDAVYFMETNTRLQVEHPVTEAVTGVDIVASQLKIASGDSIRNMSVKPAGYAIEARVTAEKRNIVE